MARFSFPDLLHPVRTPRVYRRLSRLLTILLVLSVCGRPSALLAIEAYQRWLSPLKGYRCAHARLNHGLTCSQYGKQVIAERGVILGILALRERFDACHDAAQLLRSRQCSSMSMESGSGSEEAGKCCGEMSGDFCGGCRDGADKSSGGEKSSGGGCCD